MMEPRTSVNEVEEYFQAHPESRAARVRPRAARAGAGWAIFHGDDSPGEVTVGWTLTEAFARWEDHYASTKRTQQQH